MAATGTAERQEVRAEAKWVRSSPRKARVVLDLIRGRTVPEARSVLAFSERAVARDVELVLRSAVANAEANHGLIGDELVVSAAYADDGPTLKRWRARARGRVGRIKKRSCHITVRLAEPADGVQPRRRRAAARPAAAEQPAPEQKQRRRAPRSEQPETPAEKKPRRRTPARTKQPETTEGER